MFMALVVKINMVDLSLTSSLFSLQGREVDVAGTPEEQQMFLRELETFHRENFLEYKPLKFYGQPLNSLK